MRLHLEIEALRIAFADARHFVADPAFFPIPLEDLLSPAYADERRRGISPQYALPEHIHGYPAPSRDTVYFCVVDGEGNACSFINSNYMGFGTGIVPRGWGFLCRTAGRISAWIPPTPTTLSRGKRPYHTIIPGMATRESDQSLFGPFGVMGGFMQPQGHVQVLTRLLDNALDPQSALDLPRFCIDVEKDNRSVSLEEGMPERQFPRWKRCSIPWRPLAA